MGTTKGDSPKPQHAEDGPAPPWSPAGPDRGDAEDKRLEGETVVHVRT